MLSGPLRSAHARVAALARHRAADDPELAAARAALAVLVADERERRRLLLQLLAGGRPTVAGHRSDTEGAAAA